MTPAPLDPHTFSAIMTDPEFTHIIGDIFRRESTLHISLLTLWSEETQGLTFQNHAGFSLSGYVQFLDAQRPPDLSRLFVSTSNFRTSLMTSREMHGVN
jgi:hypothetical protein